MTSHSALVAAQKGRRIVRGNKAQMKREEEMSRVRLQFILQN